MRNVMTVLMFCLVSPMVFASSYFNCDQRPDRREDPAKAMVDFEEDGITASNWSIAFRGKDLTKSAKVVEGKDGYVVTAKLSQKTAVRFIFSGYNACENGESGKAVVVLLRKNRPARAISVLECNCAVD